MLKNSRSIVLVLFVLSSSFMFGQAAELCAPSGVSVFEADMELVVSWNEPIGNVGCGDEGVTALPFTTTGTTTGMGDDWDVSGSDNADYAFTYNVANTIAIDITLCNAGTDYDTKLEIFTADANCVATTTTNYNDDNACAISCLYSSLLGVTLSPGQYYIVVDGFSTSNGNFEILIEETGTREQNVDYKTVVAQEAEKILDLGGTQADVDALWADAREHVSNVNTSREIPADCGTYVSYEVHDGSDGSLVATVTDGSLQVILDGLTNGTEYCFYVNTVYSEGTSANSDTACGIPAPWSPDPPTNVGAIIGDEKLTLTWTASTVANVGLGYVETFEIEDLAAMWEMEGNWALNAFAGNPGTGARFSWSPSETNYDYGMYSMFLPVGVVTDVEVVYDLYLSDWGGTGLEHLSVELFVDGAWVVVADHANTADISWTSFSYTVTGVSGTTQIRFRAYGADSFEINNWDIDNIGLLDASTGREIANSNISANGDYLGGTSMDLGFSLYYESSDIEYLDGAYMTFPAGFTVNSASDIGGLVFNGETGDSVSWGAWNDDGFGEQSSNADFTVNVTIADGISGPQTIGWGLSGDVYGAEPHDVSGTLIVNETSFNEYDFMGYSVFLDGVLQNDVATPSLLWVFDELTNLVEYELGVAASHFPSYSSDTITVLATPQYLFGDIVGVVLDPNGDPLDSAVVDAGGVVDTTGADGAYLLWNLNPGTYTVKAQRHGFEFTDAEVVVVAGPDAYVQDLTLQPALARANGVVAEGGDSEVYLSWKMPGGETEYDLFYYDDFFDAQLGCGGGCEFGVRFTPPGYPAELTSLLISVQGGATVAGGNIIAFLDPSGSAAGPTGDFVILASNVNLSDDGGLTQYLIDVSDAGFVIPSGDAYIMIQENSTGWMGIANDVDPQSPEFYDRNWVFSGGAYTTIFDAVGGDPTLTGDFGILGTFFGSAGRAMTTDVSGNEVELPAMDLIPTGQAGVFTTSYPSSGERSIGRNPDFVSVLEGTYVPVLPMNYSREDSLLGFSVYHMTDNGDTLVAETVGNDTSTFVQVPVNYVEYCYNVTAWWATDSYGDLQSKPSGEACAVPFTSGDADFDSDVDLADVLAVVDFILEVSTPSADQFRNCDFNADEAINVADLVMMIDVIYGPPAGRFMAFDTDALATLELMVADESSLNLNLAYEGTVRGLQFTIDYDASQIKINVPQLVLMQDNVIVTTSEKEAGKLNVVVANIGSGALNISSESLLNIPFEFVGGNGEIAEIGLMNSALAGPAGELIPVNEKSTSFDIEVLPGKFALHQNFPNPFNPTTEIRFDIADVSDVRLTVYNLMGQEVRTLAANEMVAGFHTIVWDGLNDNGTPVASGMYFYMLDAGSFHAMKKMVLLK